MYNTNINSNIHITNNRLLSSMPSGYKTLFKMQQSTINAILP